MRRLAWFFCLLLVSPTAGCVWSPGTGDEEITVASYADFGAGSEWIYDDARPTSDNSTTVTYEGVQSVAGYAAPVRVLNVSGDLFYFREDISDRLNLVGTSNDGPYDDALPLLRHNFESGKDYGPYTTDDNDCDVYVTYDRDNISVPYDHNLDRTVHTTVTTYCDGDLFPEVLEYWFAKNVGLAKWVDNDGVPWELDDKN